MNRSGAAFPHAFSPAVAVGGRRFNVTILHVGHVHRRDGDVVAEGAGQHVADFVIDAIFQECRTDPVGGRAIDLAFDDWWINYYAAVVDGDVIENLRNESISMHLVHRFVYMRRVGHGRVTGFLLDVWQLERRTPD